MKCRASLRFAMSIPAFSPKPSSKTNARLSAQPTWATKHRRGTEGVVSGVVSASNDPCSASPEVIRSLVEW